MKFLKGSALYSILTGSCPVCQQESMYKNKNPYYIKELFTMSERCSNCNTKYKMEPSFFYGAMFVSYGLGVGLSILVFLISFLLLDFSLITSFVLICIAVVGFMPLEVRLSRNIWINLFLKFKKKRAED